MISSFSELKDKALGDLKGNWTQPVLATLVYVLIAAIFSDTPYVKHTYTNGIQTTQTNFTVWSGICLLVSLFFILPMAYYSYMLIFLDFIRGEKKKLVGKLFSFFKNYIQQLFLGIFQLTESIIYLKNFTKFIKGYFSCLI